MGLYFLNIPKFCKMNNTFIGPNQVMTSSWLRLKRVPITTYTSRNKRHYYVCRFLEKSIFPEIIPILSRKKSL